MAARLYKLLQSYLLTLLLCCVQLQHSIFCMEVEKLTDCSVKISETSMIDLSPLDAGGGKARFKDFVESHYIITFKISLNFCTGITCGTTNDSALCGIPKKPFPDLITSIAPQSSASFRVDYGDMVVLNFKGKDGAIDIQLNCDEEKEGELEHPEAVHFIVRTRLNSKHACPKPLPSRWGPVSIVICTVSSTLGTYMLAEMLYNIFVKEFRSLMIIPHGVLIMDAWGRILEFWNRRYGYDDVGGGDDGGDGGAHDNGETTPILRAAQPSSSSANAIA